MENPNSSEISSEPTDDVNEKANEGMEAIHSDEEPASSQYVTAPETDDNDDRDDRFKDARMMVDADNDDGGDDDDENDDVGVSGGLNNLELEPSALIDIDDDSIDVESKSGSKKNVERGIVYLSSIPTAMDLQQIRNALSNCGKLGRVFLQEDHNSQKKRAKRTYYSEGWVEFKSKKDAKRTAKMLNCSQVGGKKRHPWFADTWNMKYLPRFKWHHLVDRLAYERAVEEQKMRIEVGAARKEAHHFRELADKADGDKRTVKKGKDINRKEWQFYQKQTEAEIKKVVEKKKQLEGDEGVWAKKKKKRKPEGDDDDVSGGNAAKTQEGVVGEKKRKKEMQDEKKTKKRALIKSIFQGGEDSDGE